MGCVGLFFVGGNKLLLDCVSDQEAEVYGEFLLHKKHHSLKTSIVSAQHISPKKHMKGTKAMDEFTYRLVFYFLITCVLSLGSAPISTRMKMGKYYHLLRFIILVPALIIEFLRVKTFG
jgi:hypothetical protein